MLKILLCDDDPFFLSLESGQLRSIIQGDSLDAAVVCAASSAGEALTYLKNCPDVDLAFLDLDFGHGKPGGIDLAPILRQHAPALRIVFATNHQEMAMNVLKSGVQPYGFLEKGSDLSQLTAGLRRYVRMALRSLPDLTAKVDTIRLSISPAETVELRISDILYLEAEKNISHGISYHTINGSHITVCGTLDGESIRLGDRFVRVHRSYLAAKNQILALRGGWLVLSDQKEIPCSLRMRSEVKKRLDQK